MIETLESPIVATAAAWKQDVRADGQARAIIGTVDATFMELILLVCIDLYRRGCPLLAEVAEDH